MEQGIGGVRAVAVFSNQMKDKVPRCDPSDCSVVSDIGWDIGNEVYLVHSPFMNCLIHLMNGPLFFNRMIDHPMV